MRYKLFLFLFLSILLTSFALAVSCNPTTISTSFQQGTPTSLTTLCNNSLNSSVSVSQTGADFTLDETSLDAFEISTIRATFNANASVGTHTGSINFGDSTSVPILFLVTAPPVQTPSG